MTIEFDCGHIAKNIGAIGLACKAHIDQCDDAQCQADVKAQAEKAGL